jgi:phosphoglycolate phosphatase
MINKYNYLIFDLDGTISDPKDGFVRSVNYALTHHGFEAREESSLTCYIGPPLEQSLAQLTDQTDPLLIQSLVAKYRERYTEIGYRENVLYDGIADALLTFARSSKVKLGVCSSKRVDFVEQILDMFDLRGVFSFVSGGEIGLEKWQQLGSVKTRYGISSNALMIGDRCFDLVAAHRNDLHGAGVLWGYGSLDELENETPQYILSDPSQLKDLPL